MGVLSRGSGFPKFSALPLRRNCAPDLKCFRGVRTCSRSSITVPSLVGLGFHPPPRRPKTLSFLSVCLCLFARHAVERQSLCARFPHEGVGVQNDFDANGWGKVCSCAPFNFQLSQIVGNWRHHTMPKSKQEGQHPLTGQRAANFRLLANQ